ncbi:MAG: hypothetical protein KIT73_14485, partial [Burkholderiales bacterium]|nr:hypothetical protein [Burkholderiales bacterium]
MHGLLAVGVIGGAAAIGAWNGILGALVAGTGVFILGLWAAMPARIAMESQVLTTKQTTCTLAATLLRQVATENREHARQIQGELEQAEGIVADATKQLIDSFNGIASQTRRQQELAIVAATGGQQQGNSDVRFMAFIDETSKTLQHFVDNTVEGSKSAMTLVEEMEKLS